MEMLVSVLVAFS